MHTPTQTIARARKEARTKTLMGRYRNLPGIGNKRLRGHLERAAINTPIQVRRQAGGTNRAYDKIPPFMSPTRDP